MSRGGCLPAPVHWLAAILSDLPLDIATPDSLAVGKNVQSSREILGMYDLKTILHHFTIFLLEAISCFLSLFRTPGLRFDSTRGLHPVGSGRICCRSFLARKEPSRSRGTSSTPAMAPTLQNRPIESYSHKQNSEGGYRDSMSSMFPVLKTSKDEIH